MSADDDDDRDDDDLDYGDPAAIRRAGLAAFATTAREIFDKYPNARSVMLGFAQYWADEADDAVHDTMVASDRETPMWPHVCGDEAEDLGAPALDGEYCWNCAEDFPYLSLDDNGASITGFEPFCTEDGSQEESSRHNYRPYAIARKREGGVVAVEVVGICRRPWDTSLDDGSGKRPPWPDARAAELFIQVCVHAADDGPRQVLADHLMERGDERGELLALELVAEVKDPDARARRDALIEAHRAESIHPLGVVIRVEGARFDRGFLVHADVYADEDDVDHVRGAEAWGTVESIRYLPGSEGLLDPAMIALREIGVIGAADVEAIVAARTPWAIETLEVAIDPDDAAVLRDATNLPALRHLVVHGDDVEVLRVLGDAAWWRRLAKVTVIGEPSLATRGLPAIANLPAFAWGPADDLDRPAGWHATHVRAGDRYDLALVGWHPDATLGACAQLVQQVRQLSPRVDLVASRYFEPTDADRTLVGIDATLDDHTIN